jgi:hypothetical protein
MQDSDKDIYENPTASRIAKNYGAALDSVDVINALAVLPTHTDDELARIRCNVQHLEFILTCTFWTTEDMTPINNAIAAGNAVLPV